jgi:hypothetical protein
MEKREGGFLRREVQERRVEVSVPLQLHLNFLSVPADSVKG